LTRKVLEAYKKLGIPLDEQERLAVSQLMRFLIAYRLATTFKGKLKDAGVIFCPISEALRDHPDLIKTILGFSVPTPYYFAALNAAVIYWWLIFYIPKGVRCPMELSTYFRINAPYRAFERTLIICREGHHVSIWRLYRAQCVMKISCTRPVVELNPMKDAVIKFLPCKTGIPRIKTAWPHYNFCHQRADCGVKIPKCHGRRWRVRQLPGNIPLYLRAIILSVNSIQWHYQYYQQASPGTRWIHIKNTPQHHCGQRHLGG